MHFSSLEIPDLWLVEPERVEGERGFFARVFCSSTLFCSSTFMERGLCTNFPQWAVSFNHRRGTSRGLHFQAVPYEEIKLVSCFRGAIFDVAVDVRPGLKSRGDWVGVELSAENRAALYIPAGFAHGFQTLPPAARGIRWDDPDLARPERQDRVISARDRSLPRLRDL
jgi:dTDP-4-dehydrorhamnose 3,5-epimerase